METSDWIELLGILLTAGIGIWIAKGIQNSVNKTRALRDFFIQELSSLRQDYQSFINSILAGKLSANDIIVTFKSFTTRITTLDEFIHLKFSIEGHPIKDAHVKLREELTGYDEFNEQFKGEVVTFSSSSILQFQNLHLVLAKAIMQQVINVNERGFRRKRKNRK